MRGRSADLHGTPLEPFDLSNSHLSGNQPAPEEPGNVFATLYHSFENQLNIRIE